MSYKCLFMYSFAFKIVHGKEINRVKKKLNCSHWKRVLREKKQQANAESMGPFYKSRMSLPRMS